MKKRGVFKYLFMDHIVPTYSHVITRERYPYDDRWNKINKISEEERNNVRQSFSNNPRRMTEKEEEKLLVTGWRSIDTNTWKFEKFEIN